ncbi:MULTISPECIES: hypothetical protein [unclassified Leeuwenhoekiella]|uniref:hypothetical protein n=1 Tax=unclassified Leeuwenhoekiella TaxID=2615029 RepID=UPI000C3E98C4|nr:MULTISPECIES: hypothetical protein [unclassified Leeuwenhoekiella]MAW95784.1 hypothetical protein [Leeuwenhoekiella sp.]MBA82945.1 hypothetical protein [Leeuwenhoekiella sp.]|tara:strand:+ start:1374 stop:1904 length:531 start_codon:yes stop_codon:yes gene_type:complete
MEAKDVKIIKQYDRHLIIKIIAALLFTIGFALVYFAFLINFEMDIDWTRDKQVAKWGKGMSGFLFFSVIAFGLGINLMKRKLIIFDLSKKRYKSEFYIGPFHWGNWYSFSDLKRIGIFKNTKDIFELNIWFTNKRYVQFEKFHDYEDALAEARYVAEILELEILDASDPRNPVLLE